MIFVLVNINQKAVEKRVLCGDDQENFRMIVREQAANPDKEFIVYREDEKNDFDAIPIETRRSSDQSQWDSIKGRANDVEKLLARMVGLDG